MSLTFPRGWLVPIAAAAAVGLAAAPATADQVRHREWWLTAGHVNTAWRVSRGGGVTVAVVDSGVDPAQPDLAGSVRTGPDYSHLGEQPGSGSWGAHGTGMAALIAGHGHGTGRADGTIGIAPAARILSIRAVPDRGDPALADPAASARLPDSIAAGIRYAVAHGAKVIDLPLDPGTVAGGRAGQSAAGGSSAERQAVRYAQAKGAVLVAPAGDNRTHGGAVNYPAAYPGVVAAGAIDHQFNLAKFSSGRSYVTVTGPGVDVGTAQPGGGYTSISSTGAASAVVAGVAALVRAEYPAFDASQVIQAITQGTSFRHAKRAGSGYGAIDAAGALRAAASINATSSRAPPSPAASARPGSGGAARPASSGFPGDVVRDLIAAAVAALIIVAVFLLWRARSRRPRARPADDTPGLESPLSGGLSGPPPAAAPLASPVGPEPGRDRRPRLAPVTGLPGPGNGKARRSAGPPWEDAPRPRRPAPTWPDAAGLAPGPGIWLMPSAPGAGPSPGPPSGPPSPDAPAPGTPSRWPSPDDAPAPGTPSRWSPPDDAPVPGTLSPLPSPDDAPPPGSPFQWPAPDGAPPPPAADWPGAADGTGATNGRAPAATGAEAGGYLRPSDEHGTVRAEPDGEDTQSFSALPPGSGRFGAVAANAPALDEEDEPPFEDEDDRHL